MPWCWRDLVALSGQLYRGVASNRGIPATDQASSAGVSEQLKTENQVQRWT